MISEWGTLVNPVLFGQVLDGVIAKKVIDCADYSSAPPGRCILGDVYELLNIHDDMAQIAPHLVIITPV